jgi:hypothetical protein
MLRGWCDIKYALYNWNAWGGDPNKVIPLTPFSKTSDRANYFKRRFAGFADFTKKF